MITSGPKHRTPSLLSALAAAVLLSACAGTPTGTNSTQGPARPVGGHGLDAFLGSYDADRDGRVPRAEFDRLREQRFRTADANGDGVLSEAEYVAEFEGRLKSQYVAQHRRPDAAYEAEMTQAYDRFRILNKAGDGRLTRAEELATADRTFKRVDSNGDGTVSREDPPRKPGQRPAQP